MSKFKVGDKVIQTDKSEYLPNGFEHEVGEVVGIEEGEFPYRVTFPSRGIKDYLPFAPEELRLADPPREGFRVGDKVRQAQRKTPYGKLTNGEYLGDYVGVVTEVADWSHYPVVAEFGDAPGHYALEWRFRPEELELVETAPESGEAQKVYIVFDQEEGEILGVFASEDAATLYRVQVEAEEGRGGWAKVIEKEVRR